MYIFKYEVRDYPDISKLEKKEGFLGRNPFKELMAFSQPINDRCIEAPDFYDKPYWYYELDLPEGSWVNMESYDYVSDCGVRGISDKQLTSEDMSDDVVVITEEYRREIDWETLQNYLKQKNLSSVEQSK